METEMKQLQKRPVLIIKTGRTAAADSAALRYTSLRDIILSSPRGRAGPGRRHYPWSPHHDVDPSAISIRNHLVKRAASAYLQSAASLYGRDQSCTARLWSNYVWRPLDSCVGYVAWSLRWVMVCVVGADRSAIA